MKGEKGEKRKQELLKTAYRMYIQNGYEETGIDEIIAEAHIAKGTYHYHFPSKEALLEEVIISARHLKKVFGSGDSEQVIFIPVSTLISTREI